MISTNYIQDQIEAKGSTNYSSIRAWEFLEYEIPLPTLQRQNEISNKFLAVSDYCSKLQAEHAQQSTYLSQLRHTILQESIEGKLTAHWRAQHPVASTSSATGDPEFDAVALLEQIKAEKQKLIAAKKIGKENPLPPIREEEMPFDLPEGWVWCRLGEIAESFAYGSSTKSKPDGKIPVLRMGNLQDGEINWDSLVYTSDEEEIEKYKLNRDDLLFNRTNSRELVGKTALFNFDREAIYAGYLVKFSMLGAISPHYINYLMNSMLHREWCNEVRIDAIGQSNINATKLRDFRVPLPPLAEQRAIVARVDRLLALVDALAAQVSERKAQADALMQAVLREAFAG